MKRGKKTFQMSFFFLLTSYVFLFCTNAKFERKCIRVYETFRKMLKASKMIWH